jgi:hypothetical protein
VILVYRWHVSVLPLESYHFLNYRHLLPSLVLYWYSACLNHRHLMRVDCAYKYATCDVMYIVQYIIDSAATFIYGNAMVVKFRTTI